MRLLRILTGFLFVFLLAFGAWFASHRCLWNDEYFSLLGSTLVTPYKSIIFGLVGEGNNSPLFYIIQKAQCDLFSYHPPQEWVAGHWEGVHVFDQVFLRMQPIFFMAAALSALFYYFSRRNSWIVGVYALAVAMTSSLFWFHWAEARPYAGWFALSMFQILLLLNILEGPVDHCKKSWRCLVVVHWLLSLASSVSIIQIIAAGVVLGVFHRPKIYGYISLVLVPVMISIFYYLHAPQYSFFFVDGPMALINANIPKDRLFVIFLSALVLVVQCRGKDCKAYLEIKYLAFLLLMLGAFGLVLLKLKWGQLEGRHGFQVSSRYFLSLTPVGIVGVVLFSVYLVRAFPSRVWKAVAIMILFCFLAFRFQKMTQQVQINKIFSSHLT